MDFFYLLFADFYNAVEDKAGCNSIGNTVAQSHEQAGKKCRDCLFQVVPFNFCKGGNHHTADDNQGRGGCGEGGE